MDYPEDDSKNPLLAFPKVKELLGIPNEAYDEVSLKGFTFLVFPQFIDPKDFAAQYEAPIKKAIAEHPGKPVFVLVDNVTEVEQ